MKWRYRLSVYSLQMVCNQPYLYINCNNNKTVCTFLRDFWWVCRLLFFAWVCVWICIHIIYRPLLIQTLMVNNLISQVSRTVTVTLPQHAVPERLKLAKILALWGIVAPAVSCLECLRYLWLARWAGHSPWKPVLMSRCYAPYVDGWKGGCLRGHKYSYLLVSSLYANPFTLAGSTYGIALRRTNGWRVVKESRHV